MNYKEILSAIDEELKKPDGLENWTNYLRLKEPEMFAWLTSRCSEMLFYLADKMCVPIQNGNIILTMLLESFISGYLVKYRADQIYVTNLISNNSHTHNYYCWLSGELPDKFYNYSVKGLPLESDLCIAYNAHKSLQKIVNSIVNLKEEKKVVEKPVTSSVDKNIVAYTPDLFDKNKESK